MYKNKKQYRHPEHDYSSNGYYFVTVCTKNREEFFGKNQKGKVVLSDVGRIVEKVLVSSSDHHNISLDTFVIMPDHIHCIIIIPELLDKKAGGYGRNEDYGRNAARCVPTEAYGFASKPLGALSVVIRSFKSECTKQIKKEHPWFAWQPRFHDRIIRNEEELHQIQDYIKINPQKHYLNEIGDWY